MNKYICKKCKRIFKQKSHLEDHLNKKKNPCGDENVYIQTINTKFLHTNPHKSTQNPHKIHTNSTQKHIEDDENNKNKEDEMLVDVNHYVCEFCNLNFTRSDSLKRHILKYCKNKKHIQNIEELQSKINKKKYVPSEQYEELKENNKKLVEMLDEYKNFIKQNNLLKDVIPHVEDVNNKIINNGTSNINNGVIVNNKKITNANTVINNIVQFGKEDISRFNIVEMMNIYLKSTGGNIFANMLKFINFNPKFPEYFNILMTDLARENVKIHNGTKFITKKFKNVKEEILSSVGSHITKMCSSYISNPKIKKSPSTLEKIKINDISVKLIIGDDITPCFMIKNEKSIENNSDSDSSSGYLDVDGENKLLHFEKKRQGLQELTIQKIKDELYNSRDLLNNFI
jgi:hypothetical protein